jgi:hypothetical protein
LKKKLQKIVLMEQNVTSEDFMVLQNTARLPPAKGLRRVNDSPSSDAL